MEASVIIVTRDRKELLSRALDSVIAQDFPKNSFEIIVVDDGSEKDGLKPLVEERKKRFRNIKYVSQDSLGLSKGRNNGIKNASGRIIAFTDDDIIADKNWLKEVAAGFTRGVVGVEGKITTDTPRRLFTNAPENLSGGRFTGANCAYLKSVYEKAGYYTGKFSFWREDSEFAFRAMRFGKIVFREKAVIHHPLRKDPPESVFRYLFFLRNDWLLLFWHPKKFLRYFTRGVMKDFGKTIGVWSGFIFSFLFFPIGFVIMASLVPIGAWLTLRGSGFTATWTEALLFTALNFLKYVIYPVALAVGFVKAVIFAALNPRN